MIELEGITKVYQMGQVQVHALRGMSLRIEPGEWVSIVGPSGSGKSTLMHIIGCLDTPTSGSYRLNGLEVSSMDEKSLSTVRNQEIGFVFQMFNLLPRISALKQVMLPMQYARGKAKLPLRKRREIAAKALEMVGLGDRLNHHPAELSGGEQQRIAIARALVNNPSIILADEPTGNLDTQSGAEVMEIFRKLHRERGIIIVVVTHDDEIAGMAERIVHLRDGLIVDDVGVGGEKEKA